MYSGDNLERSKILLSAILHLCSVGRGTHQVWVERGGKSFMSSCIWLSIIIVELKLCYWYWWSEGNCYSVFNPFHVIFIFSCDIAAPEKWLNPWVYIQQSAGHWLVCSNYRGGFVLNHCNQRFFVCFCTLKWIFWRDCPQWNFLHRDNRFPQNEMPQTCLHLCSALHYITVSPNSPYEGLKGIPGY